MCRCGDRGLCETYTQSLPRCVVCVFVKAEMDQRNTQQQFEEQFSDVLSRLQSKQLFQSDWDVAAFVLFFTFFGEWKLITLGLYLSRNSTPLCAFCSAVLRYGSCADHPGPHPLLLLLWWWKGKNTSMHRCEGLPQVDKRGRAKMGCVFYKWFRTCILFINSDMGLCGEPQGSVLVWSHRYNLPLEHAIQMFYCCTF